ncbi:hypothetical protein [Roseococcus suduntuyensis]|uniref:Tetratricopeptide repeat-containing protein n=1 Tax=Roseococcus suduntuyensis TaxID=455361 RepID=A0A840AJL2_9PROT|nr:hypothetical protein [Roseococcus suduntuyensis]MBB3900225.1 hypothetical protein [Roseococcus suduntuyensis]
MLNLKSVVGRLRKAFSLSPTVPGEPTPEPKEEPEVDRLMARAVALKQQGDVAAAWSCLLRALPLVPEPRPLGVHLLHAGLAVRMGLMGEAESAARLAMQITEGRDHTMARYALASLLAVTGRPEEAQRLFAEPAEVMLGHGGIACTSAIRLLLPDTPPPDAALPFSRVMDAPRGVPPDPSRPLLFAAGDGAYISRFGPAYAAAAARQGVGVQLHVVNPEPGLEPLLETLAGRVFLTSERSTLDGWDDGARRAYYSCARLLVLPEVLKRQAGPVTMTDLDQLLLRSPAALFRAEDDVSLLRLPGNEFNFLSYVSATLAVFRPGPGSGRFAATAAGLLRACLAERAPQWHTDQAVLAATLLGGQGFTSGAVDPALVHLAETEPTLHGPACFWSITASLAANAQKEQAATFRAFLEGSSGRHRELTSSDRQG